MKNCSAKLNSKIHFKLNSVINYWKKKLHTGGTGNDGPSVISFNWNLWDTLKKKMEDIYDSTDNCLPQARFTTISGFDWQKYYYHKKLTAKDWGCIPVSLLLSSCSKTFHILCLVLSVYLIMNGKQTKIIYRLTKSYVHGKIMISALSLLDWPASNFSLQCHPWIT